MAHTITDVDMIGNNLQVSSITTKAGTADVKVPSGAVVAAGTGSGSAGNTGGAVATHVMPITVGGTVYYVPLCNTNA